MTVVVIYVDDKPYQVDESNNLLRACLGVGLEIPYFCWHPALGSVGACRQCAVKLYRDDQDTAGRIVMSCMTPVTAGMRISIKEPQVKEFRRSVIEWLMVNHPHDCPVYDEGGECHLQDMTVMTGHNYRRYRFSKRTQVNQNLGPFINHEMNRCIQCYRCVRYYREYAGGRDFNVFGCHDRLYFGRHAEGALESEFSGNLVEVCPTGVFTDKTLKQHPVRKWDFQSAPSVCVHCSLGCNTLADERGGLLRRTRNRYNGEVNGYFLCDRGRYAYEFVNSPARIQHSYKRTEGKVERLSRADLLRQIQPLLEQKERVIGIGSQRASLEANFLLRELVGAERFSAGLPADQLDLITGAVDILRSGPAQAPTLKDLAESDAVLVLGEDLTNTAPLSALALRQSVLQQPGQIAERARIPRWQDHSFRAVLAGAKGPLFIASPQQTKLDDVATRVVRAAPSEVAQLGQACARILRASEGTAVVPSRFDVAAKEIAEALRQAQRPLIMSGVQLQDGAVLEAAANVAWALCAGGRLAKLGFALPACNSFGLALLGGKPLEEVCDLLADGQADTVVVLENDLAALGELGLTLLRSARHVIVLDQVEQDTAKAAHYVMAAAAYAESDGTLVNNEGRAQRYVRAFVPAPEIRESWRWLRDLLEARGDLELGQWQSFGAVSAALAESSPLFAPLKELLPPQASPIAGQKIPRQPQRYSGRTALTANLSVHEPKPLEDQDSPLAFSMEGYQGRAPAPLIPFFHAPGWNSIQSVTRYQREAGGPLLGGDPGRRLIKGAAAAPVFFESAQEEFQPKVDAFLLFPIAQIFGSEQLSALGAAIQERIPADFAALNQADAKQIGVQEGEQIEIVVADRSRSFVVTLKHDIALGTVGYFSRRPGFVKSLRSCWCKIVKAGQGHV